MVPESWVWPPCAGQLAKQSSRRTRLRGAALCGLALVLSGCGSNDHKHAPKNAVGLDCRSQPTRTLKGLGSRTACRAQCDEQQNCHAWSYDNAGDRCMLREYCELFTWGTAGVEVGFKPHLPQPIICPMPEKDICCPSNDIKVLQDGDFTDCCATCHSTPGCMLFELEEGVCHLKSGCPDKKYKEDSGTCSRASEVGWMQRPGAASFPKQSESPYYKVGRGWMNVTGYSCGDGFPATAIFYPIGQGPFGIVVHRVGTGGQLDEMDEWFVTMASLGMIVLAPYTGSGTCEGGAWTDMLRVLEVVYENGLQCQGCDVPPGDVDFQKLAFSGHSMGAMAAMTDSYNAAKLSKFRHADKVVVRAVVSAHDVGEPEKVPEDVAVFVCGGSRDWTMPTKKVNSTYRKLNTMAKVGASMLGAGHNEPGIHIQDGLGNGARENWWMSVFLACHIGPDSMQERHCDTIHGDGPGSMVATQSWRMLLRKHPKYNATRIRLHESQQLSDTDSTSFVA